jgi:hypothetical protein
VLGFRIHAILRCQVPHRACQFIHREIESNQEQNYSHDSVSQVSPFARHGIVSSVLPCESTHPHGFSIDVPSEGGASGSPIFLAEEATVVGILHASFDHAPVTYGVPAWILKQGLDALKWEPQPGKATLDAVVEADTAVSKPQLIVTSKPEDEFLDGVCSICRSVKFHLTGNTLERKQVLRKMFDNHVRRDHPPTAESGA